MLQPENYIRQRARTLPFYECWTNNDWKERRMAYIVVAQYVLEEDTEEIELMDIECGIDGKPGYIKGPHESETYAAQIIAQLERTAGPGNYSFMKEDDWDSDEDESDDKFWDDESDNEEIK